MAGWSRPRISGQGVALSAPTRTCSSQVTRPHLAPAHTAPDWPGLGHVTRGGVVGSLVEVTEVWWGLWGCSLLGTQV